MLNPSDSGKLFTLNACKKINIDELVKEANKHLKRSLLEAQIGVFNTKIELTTSRTRFGGKKYWFLCPECKKRRGVLYQHPMNSKIACRKCVNLNYISQRYKGMIENN
jgi:hypothetical protein